MAEDRRILVLVSILVLSGIFILFNASSFIASQLDKCGNDPFYYVKKQLISIFGGILVMLFLYNWKLDNLRRIALPGLLASIILLVLVLLIGREVNGARRWINLRVTTFQPSEMAEFFILVYISAFISAYKNFNKSHIKIIGLLILCFTVIFLIAIEPNFSTALLMCAFVFGLLAISDIPKGYIFSMASVAAVGFFALLLRYAHAMTRLKMLTGSVQSEQLDNSILAVANGGLFGEGLGMGKFKLFFIPEVHSDFIFTTIAEELGFVGCVILIGLFLLFLKFGIEVAKNSYNSFHKSLAYGVTVIIFSKALIHMAISLKIMPTTGLVLPFISYGGTAMIFNLAMVGILMNIARENRIAK